LVVLSVVFISGSSSHHAVADFDATDLGKISHLRALLLRCDRLDVWQRLNVGLILSHAQPEKQ
jgi:hypothetical protein